MGLAHYLRVARQRWITILGVFLVCVAAAAILTLRATPEYASQIRLFVATSQGDANQAYSGGLFAQSRVKSYADLITGDEVSRQVIERLKLTDEPRKLASQISAVAQLDTVVLNITVTDPSPYRAQLLAQTTGEVVVDYVEELESSGKDGESAVKTTIVDRATLPTDPVSPQPVQNALIGITLGLVLGFGAAALRDALDNSVNTTEDLAGATDDAPVLGSIHHDRGAARRPLISDLPASAPRAEAYRVLRTNLQFIRVNAPTRVFTITSALSDEGKSTTSVNLALSLAESGQRVLLIEGDLRRPEATAYLGLVTAVGLSTVLIGQVSIPNALQRHGQFDVLAAGVTPPNPTELLQPTEMRRLLGELRASYDVILIDAPPLLPVADAALLSAASDGAILVVKQGSTTRAQVAAACERLEAVDARLVGTVLNMTKERRSGGYGYDRSYAPRGTSSGRGLGIFGRGSGAAGAAAGAGDLKAAERSERQERKDSERRERDARKRTDREERQERKRAAQEAKDARRRADIEAKHERKRAAAEAEAEAARAAREAAAERDRAAKATREERAQQRQAEVERQLAEVEAKREREQADREAKEAARAAEAEAKRAAEQAARDAKEEQKRVNREAKQARKDERRQAKTGRRSSKDAPVPTTDQSRDVELVEEEFDGLDSLMSAEPDAEAGSGPEDWEDPWDEPLAEPAGDVGDQADEPVETLAEDAPSAAEGEGEDDEEAEGGAHAAGPVPLAAVAKPRVARRRKPPSRRSGRGRGR